MQPASIKETVTSASFTRLCVPSGLHGPAMALLHHTDCKGPAAHPGLSPNISYCTPMPLSGSSVHCHAHSFTYCFSEYLGLYYQGRFLPLSRSHVMCCLHRWQFTFASESCVWLPKPPDELSDFSFLSSEANGNPLTFISVR